jgi:hypothetical protein
LVDRASGPKPVVRLQCIRTSNQNTIYEKDAQIRHLCLCGCDLYFRIRILNSDQAIAASASSVKSAKSKKTVKPASKVDHNAIGFKAFQKGDFKAALKALIFRSRLITKRIWFFKPCACVSCHQRESGPEDYCAYESNWVYLALSSLSKAIDVNRKQVVAKLKEVKGTKLY